MPGVLVAAMYLSNRGLFLCLHIASSKREGELGEIETVNVENSPNSLSV